MIKGRKKHLVKKTFIARSSSWLRAPKSGIHNASKKLGDFVKKGEILGEISNPFGEHKTNIKAHEEGVIVGMSILPLANKGDALFHIASEKAAKHFEEKNHLHDHFESIDPINSR
jgi:hypothetical protein